MLLIGRDLSPFVRRSATLLNLAGIEYERKSVNTVEDADFIRMHNPLGRVPALVLDDQEVIVDSHAIVDHTLQLASNASSLLPASGAARRQTLYQSSVAVGCMEKGVASAYEKSQKPESHFYAPYQEKLRKQVSAGLLHLEERLGSADWFGGDAPNLADIDAVVALDFFNIVAPKTAEKLSIERLVALASRANDLPAFSNTQWQG